ncbi:uncharacterized protein LOC109862142 isoform X2 [Pseudomyrmex gracilis]|uniref:uncharacterized protein LOC109862142 isoform X2 n=1 Tax=Pseudomyrmex gracilis TaxID=219809 RepID=UPI0009949DA5|nr:uncharacterized protein LOC109862142 isoform X2 [Pseudomyrmex gracilis]XP_020297678.1 uncharacterized protein LOC109862142 isoform X2 [Pseudomyrmex gracilis]XP_020297680.1 uncharacterized protein LOC109862142 isoform X2 [Pseudomyrmex gracilis]XP_020297681.1 uncharacterized protein LOC109862142 isoform X2 [Pseudomyrmex gracilis]XP_020297682.1 uncharacterized protein LOC109862142 isoform X2 [Pseudomyrmex gracilis]
MKHFFCKIICGRKRHKQKNTKAKETKRSDVNDGRCACCLAPFCLSRSVRCSNCGSRICRKVCSRWNTSDTTWLCIFCHQQKFPQSYMTRSKKWFETFGGVANKKELHNIFGTAKSQVYIEGHEAPNTEKTQEHQENKRITYAIKKFVEKIIEDIIIDNVDNMPIEHLYKDPECNFRIPSRKNDSSLEAIQVWSQFSISAKEVNR